MNENKGVYLTMRDDRNNSDITTEDLSEEQWWLILLSLVTDVPVKEWNEFAHDLYIRIVFHHHIKLLML